MFFEGLEFSVVLLFIIVGLRIEIFLVAYFKKFKGFYCCLAYYNFRVSYLLVDPLPEIEKLHAAGPEQPSKDVFFRSKVYS